MLSDQQGNPLSGATPAAKTLFDQAVQAFNLYCGDPVSLLDQAVEQAPHFTMAHILKAYLYGVATEPDAAVAARAFVDTAKTLPLNEREASLIAASEQLLRGNWTAAGIALDYHNTAYPLDLIGLQCGHLIDFYRASARNLRDRIARVLPKWSPEVPGYSILLGMYAFGLEECGHYQRAEEEGRRAVELQPLDCWAHHAVAHVMEMQGRAEDGIGWMSARESCWSGVDNFFRVHNWWHLALYHLELGQVDKALALYDGPIRGDRSGVALDMIDASALLWRLTLQGCDLTDRWRELADCWDRHADGRLYPFNDWHAVMAYLGAGRDQPLERIRAALQDPTEQGGEVRNWARYTGLPLVEGFIAFWHGEYRKAAERLYGARYIVNSFGGSHAQRDIIDWTLMESVLRGGLRNLSEALASERLALKPHSPVNRKFLARARADAEVTP